MQIGHVFLLPEKYLICRNLAENLREGWFLWFADDGSPVGYDVPREGFVMVCIPRFKMNSSCRVSFWLLFDKGIMPHMHSYPPFSFLYGVLINLLTRLPVND